MTVEQLKPIHMECLAEQGNAQAADVLKRQGYLQALIEGGPALAGIVDKGIVGCVGMIEQNPGNYRCWAILDERLGSLHFVSVVKTMRRFFAESDRRRVETIVQYGNRKGERWVRLLGFGNPVLMRKFNEHGDAWLYEMVSRGKDDC